MCLTCAALTMLYEDSAGHSHDSTVSGPLIMHTILSATHRFNSNRLLDTFWPIDRARNTHKFAVVPTIATKTTWTAINDVATVEKSSSEIKRKTKNEIFFISIYLSRILKHSKMSPYVNVTFWNISDEWKISFFCSR